MRNFRRGATAKGMNSTQREPIDQCATYLANHAAYLNYPDYLAKGYPIATGVIEGACRHLVKDRMEITGARWGLEGGEAVLKLRALVINGDFDAYWDFHEQQGQSVTHYIMDGGAFDRAAEVLLATGFQLRWQSYAFNEEEGRRKAASKTKYTCPECEQNAWARPSAHLVCGDCEVEMQEQ